MIGQTFSHFEILEKLGQGGMGVVYKARDTRLNRLVALKFLPPDLADSPVLATRFEQEARAISALNHPHIATIHDMENVEGRRFLVLEYLPGGTLREKLREARASGRPLSLGSIVTIAAQIAEGLAHAHRAGIVHRDVKADNIMFTAEGMVRITDFGLAKSAHREDITRDGTTVGTAAYMSPEQATGGDADGRSDIFSLGIVVFEMIAGTRPFGGGNEIATLHAIVHQPAPPLSRYRVVPDALNAIVCRMLEKDRYQRFQRTEDLAAELRALQNHPDLSVAAHTAMGSGVATVSLRQLPSQGKPHARFGWKAVAVAAGVLLALLAFPLRQMFFSPAEKLPVEKHIAVLPFSTSGREAGREAEQQAFSTGFSDILTQELTQLAQSRTNAWVLPESELRRNNVTTAADARRLLGATIAVTGDVIRSPGRAGFHLKVLDAASGRVLRERSISRAGGDFSALQDEVVQATAAMLDLQVAPDAFSLMAAGGTGVATAYDCYVQASGYLQRFDRGGVDSAISLFQRAIQRDPAYALAYAGLGEAFFRKYAITKDARYLEPARSQTEQAISRNQRLASPHITLGSIAAATGNLDAAVAQFRQALELDPVDAGAYREMAKAYAAARKLPEAEENYRKAIRLRPDFWLGYSGIAVFYNHIGRYADAEKALLKVIELTPDNQLNYRNLGGVYVLLGRYAEAEKMLKKSIAILPTGAAYLNLGSLYFYQGRYGAAVPMMEKAVALAARDSHLSVAWSGLADTYRWNVETAAKAPDAYRKAIQLAEAELATNPENAVLLSQIALNEAKIGDVPAALEKIAKARRIAPADLAVLYDSAIVYEMANQRRRALAALEAAVRGGYSTEQVRHEPELAKLRSDPAYLR